MNWKTLSKPLAQLAGGLTGAIVLYSVLRNTRLLEFTSRETEGFNTLILLIGSIYAVMFAFVIFVIWGQFSEVERLAARESGLLYDLLRFSRYINPDAQHSIRRAITDYSRLVSTAEWEALGGRQKDIETENAFSGVLKAVVQAVPTTPAEQLMNGRLVDIALNAGECRNERIAKSLTRVPPTLMRLVQGMACALVFLIFIYPFHHAVIGGSCFVIVASILYFANFVMTDTDNPFSGQCNVSPQVFADLVK